MSTPPNIRRKEELERELDKCDFLLDLLNKMEQSQRCFIARARNDALEARKKVLSELLSFDDKEKIIDVQG